jgi:hypothetical protein
MTDTSDFPLPLRSHRNESALPKEFRRLAVEDPGIQHDRLDARRSQLLERRFHERAADAPPAMRRMHSDLVDLG